ncbi:MAG TPA: hypothetical protein VK429_08285, partial [Patescibacteria group bacterium]|nr:hypothetical protein [Patescibacteria group bacterium]
MTPVQGSENGAKPRWAPGEHAKYALLLPLILLYLVVSGFEDQHALMKGVSRWLGVAVLVLTLYVSRVGKKFVLTVACLALIAAAAWRPARAYHGVLEFVVVAAFGAMILLAPVAILRRVRREFAEEGV